MSGLLHEREFSRRTFLKGGGALVVGFSVFGSALAGKAAADSPFASNPINQSQIDSWITINADNTASIKSGAISQGTGSITGILQIAAEELDLDISQVRHVADDTDVTPDTGPKDASNTIQGGAGRGVRAAAASARQVLLGLAATQLGVSVSQLSVAKGVVSGGGKSVSYGELLGGKLFNVQMPASWGMQSLNGIGTANGLSAGAAPAKPVSDYSVVGTRVPSIEIPPIVTGAATYIQNVRVPGMLHGRVVRPQGQTVYGFGTPIVSVDEGSIAHIPGARVVRKGDFLGVVAPHEYDAIQAAAQLKVTWAQPPAVLPGGGDEFAAMRALEAAGKTVISNTDLQRAAPNTGDVSGALASAAHTVSETYAWPTNVHTPIGPQCAVAEVTPEGARIFSGTQGAYRTRDYAAPVLGLPAQQVRVTAFPMGGCYGNGCQYRDVAQAAALMSQLVGAPVRVQLMRWDEIGWDATAPGTLMQLRAGIDGKGNLVAFEYTHYYPQYENEQVELTAQQVGTPLLPPSISGNFYPGSMYNVPNNRYTLKSIPLPGNWVKVDWMRAGSSPHATFAAEQVIDELAAAAGMDAVAFRRQNVTTTAAAKQLLPVLDAVTAAADWQPKVAGSNRSDATVVSGRGIAWANTYGPGEAAAAIADIDVNKKTGKITVKHIYTAYSAGLSVNPGLVENQIVGGTTQIVSRVLVEQYRYSKTNVTSLDFVSYPILRFKDAPQVTPIVVQQTDLPAGPVGEPPTQAAPAAIANAFFDATGVRLRTAPLTPARVRAALTAAGVA